MIASMGWGVRSWLFISIARVLLVVFLVALGWLGWQLWMLHGSLSLIHWTTNDGGLELDHMPGKGHIFLTVNEAFSSHSQRVWIKDHAGATERWIGRVHVPPPEDLFERSRIHLKYSDALGLCRFYSIATPNQRLDIESYVADLRKNGKLSKDDLDCFDKVLPSAE